MPRPSAILQSEFPYHVTGRALNKEEFKIPIEDVWEIMSYQLYYISWIYKAKIHAFVLMPNHFHLIISTPLANLDVIMAHFMKECGRQMNNESGRINSVYGNRHFRCVIQSEHHFANVYKYVYRNPVDAYLSKTCETYKYSSLNFLLGAQHACFPVVYDHILFQDVVSTLKLINTPPLQKNLEAIQKATRKIEFKLAKDGRKKNTLEYQRL